MEVRTCRAAGSLYLARKSGLSRRIHRGMALESDCQYWLPVNHGERTVILTRAKEKHADMVDCLGPRQLKGGLGLVDLLEIRLQEPSSYAATKHRSVDSIGVVGKVICPYCSYSNDLISGLRCVRVTRSWCNLNHIRRPGHNNSQ